MYESLGPAHDDAPDRLSHVFLYLPERGDPRRSHRALGGPGTEASDIVIEIDSTIEQADSMTMVYDGATGTGPDICRHAFDTAVGGPHSVRVPADGIRQVCLCPA